MAQKRSRREYEADLRRQQAPFVVYGTPLPLLDENTRDDGSYVPIWKQEVTDERGRKRLHGAFTGGFSAGYFNSVGSKEGWTPSTFVSSRSNRAKDVKDGHQQKVEDFMDEEDIREHDESRQISTADGFAGFGTQNDQPARHALDDIFKPVQDTMGEKLLNKMGWKKGQGIGPRVRRKVDPSDEASEVKEFAPEDSPTLEYSQRQDTKGLGTGDEPSLTGRNASRQDSKSRGLEDPDEDGQIGLSFTRSLSMTKKSIKSSGIGVGSLNDTGSDDEDPYEMGPKVSYNRVLGGDKKTKKPKGPSSNANPLLKSAPVFISKKLPTILSSLRKCHDGKLPLSGFSLADLHDLDNFGAISLSDEKYKPPEVPDDWQPSKLDTKHDPTTQSSQPITSQPQTAQSRASILKETPLPSKSIFDFLSPAARDRLANASGKTNLPPALNEAPPLTPSAGSSIPLPNQPTLPYPHLDPPTATTALARLRTDKTNTRPYADDLPKQGRYKDFLRFSADPLPITQRIPPLRAPAHKFNDNEHIAELQEFANTANLFKPATGFLASKFTSAASGSVPRNSDNAGSESAGGEEDAEDLLRRPVENPKDPAEEAARMGMFGVATRSSIGFYPTKLVCRRFGVDLPVGIDG